MEGVVLMDKKEKNAGLRSLDGEFSFTTLPKETDEEQDELEKEKNK